MPPFSIKESPTDGSDSCVLTEKPSQIFAFVTVNKIPMKVMFDSGATASFINRIALTRIHHLPIKFKNITYTMADGHTTMEVIGTVKIFIELNNIKADIEIGIVDSLCTDCMLGMDYMSKYKVTLNNYLKQVQINTSAGPTTLLMVQHSIKTTKALCRSLQFVHLNPY